MVVAKTLALVIVAMVLVIVVMVVMVVMVVVFMVVAVMVAMVVLMVVAVMVVMVVLMVVVAMVRLGRDCGWIRAPQLPTVCCCGVATGGVHGVVLRVRRQNPQHHHVLLQRPHGG